MLRAGGSIRLYMRTLWPSCHIKTETFPTGRPGCRKTRAPLHGQARRHRGRVPTDSWTPTARVSTHMHHTALDRPACQKHLLHQQPLSAARAQDPWQLNSKPSFMTRFLMKARPSHGAGVGVGWGGAGPGSGVQEVGGLLGQLPLAQPSPGSSRHGAPTAANLPLGRSCQGWKPTQQVKAPPSGVGQGGRGCPKAHGTELGSPGPQAGEECEVRWTQEGFGGPSPGAH